MQPLAALENALLRQRGHLLLWVPVAFGCGIGLYFLCPEEPSRGALLALGGGAVAGLGLSRMLSEAWRPLLVALALVAAGVVWAALRAHQVAAPQLGWRFYGTVEGRILAIDRSGSGAPRWLLGDVSLSSVRATQTPLRVRMSLHDAADGQGIAVGARVRLLGHLSPPGGPVEPGGFDFQRHSWFLQLGAVGYTKKPVILLAPAPPDLRTDIRRAVQARLAQHLSPDLAGFAAAITLGTRADLDPAQVQHLRRSNLAHLLAISGLHMGLVTMTVFIALRAVVAPLLGPAPRLAAKKIAALGAVIAGAVYLWISGGAVPTERAFVMAVILFGAVLLDRRAFTLRAVALAAMVVLLRRPEALVSPGFQMSFAATTALVGLLGAMQMGRWRVPGLGVLMTSAIAGAATAPFVAAHFNMVSHLGLLGNLLAVPVMGSVVMPSALAAGLCAPLGADGPFLWLMGQGIGWILAVAGWVSGLPHAVGMVPAPPGWALPCIALGGLSVALWQGRARWGGTALIVVALLGWLGAERPPLLIAQTGGLGGMLTPQGRALSKPRGDGFAAGVWLENDGDAARQAEAAARAGWQVSGRVARGQLGAATVILATGKRATQSVQGCGGAKLFVTNVEDHAYRPCAHYDAKSLRDSGALAVWAEAEGLRILTARAHGGNRLWNDAGVRRRAVRVLAKL